MMKPAKLMLTMLFLVGGISAHADDSIHHPDGNEGPGGRPPRPALTEAQKACFTDNGLTAPGEGAPPKERPSKEVREKLHACLKKNGLEHFGPPHGDHKGPPPPEGGSSDAQSSGSGE